MLPTNKKAEIGNIYKLPKMGLFNEIAANNHNNGNFDMQPQHLYFISEEKVSNVGDWFLVILYDENDKEYLFLEQVGTIFDGWVNNSFNKTTRHIDNCYKVIATTDLSIKTSIFSHFSQELVKVSV